VLRRELAIEGEVLVTAGGTVATDTVIAQTTRQFLRPYFLNVARVMRIAPEEIGGVLEKRIGDDVALDEVIARNPQRFARPASYRSPVEGRVEKVLPDGTVVVRERPERARVLTTVEVAKELGVYPERLKPHLRVSVGDEIERGQWLGAIVGTGRFTTSKSPVRGKVSRIDAHFGMVMIEPLLEELEVLAWLPGTVEDVTDRGCTVANEGVEIDGVWGHGGEAAGPLAIERVEEGHIVVLAAVEPPDVSRLRDAGVAGLITGGTDLKGVLDPHPGFTVIVTEGFGARPMAPALRRVLEAHEGRLALVDGTTQLRVGVRRPKIILPEAVA
jgi:hypothetical protein